MRELIAGRAPTVAIPMQTPPQQQADSSTAQPVLAFDYGTRRIGVAVGDLALRTAHPLVTLDARDRTQSEAQIRALIEEWQPVQLVVGVPCSLDGSEHAMTRSARAFGRALGRRHALPVAQVDERLTSVEADARLREAGASAAERDHVLDAHAACVILRAFIDQRDRSDAGRNDMSAAS